MKTALAVDPANPLLGALQAFLREILTEDVLEYILNSRGVRLIEQDLGSHKAGWYCHQKNLVCLNSKLRPHQRIPTLLHELVHCVNEHDGQQSEEVENWVDGLVSMIMVNPQGYANYEAEILDTIALEDGPGDVDWARVIPIVRELYVPWWLLRSYAQIDNRVPAVGVVNDERIKPSGTVPLSRNASSQLVKKAGRL